MPDRDALSLAAPRQIANALAELAGRTGRLSLGTASTAVAELARQGLLDLAKLRAAAAGTPLRIRCSCSILDALRRAG